ncbi:MAG: YfcC family protein [Gemmatimonadaceae bacterium]|nr:YfcC family protein [Gemmatimonadaceae bacterium]
MRLPHPVVLLLVAIGVAAALTWVLPAGEYERRDDPGTGRRVAIAGTYHRVEAAPVGPFRTVMAVPRGFAAGIDVIMTILMCGAAWIVVDRIGTLTVVVGALVRRFRGRGQLAIPWVVLFFATMGALENMQEEIIPLIPVLLLLGRGIGVNATTVVAMSAGAAIVGSAFGPTNPFQAGIALKLAELPPLTGAGVRLASLAVGVAVWVAWIFRYAARNPQPIDESGETGRSMTGRDHVIMACLLLPLAAYVVGVMVLGWGFDELSAAFLLGGVAAGLIGGLGVTGTTTAFLRGMQDMLPAATMVALARSVSVVLNDGKVIDTILHGLATPLSQVPAMVTAGLMVPVQALIHVPVTSVSGQAALTMPIFAPLGDLVGLSRNVVVMAYQTGAGLMEMLTPTNGALLAVLLAAGVSYGQWVRFALGGTLLLAVVGFGAMALS